MSRDDEARPIKAPAKHQVGEGLETLSVEELTERIALLKREIDRLEAAIASKQASRQAADAFFKR